MTERDARSVKRMTDPRALRALAHPLRLEVVHLLGSREISFGELLVQMEISKTKLSQHLAVLRRSRIVAARRDAARIFYRLTHPEIQAACDAVSHVLSRHLAELQSETTVLLRRVGGTRRR